jgi:hypothetical protein
MFNTYFFRHNEIKKVKGRKAGVYSALQVEEADCTLTPDVVPSFISRGAITPSGARALC